MKTNKLFFSTLCLFGLCVGTGLAGVVLVEDGKGQIPVVLTDNTTPYLEEAVDELISYIGKISGAKLNLVRGNSPMVPESAIWIGFQPPLKELFPDIDFEFENPEEILISANEQHLVIAGRDRWQKEYLQVKGRNFDIEGRQEEYGTINAIYTFIQKYLDVRWFWPGESGEDVPAQKTITFEPFRYRHVPQFRQRNQMFRLSALGDSRGHSHNWVRRQRVQLDSFSADSSHAFSTWWAKYHETHPDYFALQPDGTRSGFPGPGKAKICQSNPAVWEQWLQNVAATLETTPYKKDFSASPNDSYHRGHCVCENCRAWDNPDANLLTYTWQGISQEYVALSDRQVTFANTLGRLLKERFPGQNLTVDMHAYGHYRDAPVAAVPDDNVIISSVANIFYGNPEMNANHKKQFAAWAKVAPRLIVRPNLWQNISRLGLPEFDIPTTVAGMRFLAENRCMGIYFDTLWEHWASHGIAYYLLAQLAWDPLQDWEALLEDYYIRGFGPAAEEIHGYWTSLSSSYAEFAQQPSPRLARLTPEAPVFQSYPAVLGRANEHLKRAAELAGDSIYGERVAFLQAGCDLSRLLIEMWELSLHEKIDGKDHREERQANWDKVLDLVEKHPLALNFGFTRSAATKMNLLANVKTRKLQWRKN